MVIFFISGRKIKLVAIEGTQNIIDAINKDCKIIFPSSHVVYEGIQKVKYNISENDELKPVLSYSSSKAINEEQIKNSGKNYIILRLGSVYGYSTDTTRIDIMPNLFSKISKSSSIKTSSIKISLVASPPLFFILYSILVCFSKRVFLIVARI